MASELERSRILVVDDNAANAELIEAYVKATAWQVEVASSGQETLDMAAAAPRPDLILLDIMMPE